MCGSERLVICCATDEAHRDVMQNYSGELLRLTQHHNVKLYSPYEILNPRIHQNEVSLPSEGVIDELHSSNLKVAVMHAYTKSKWLARVLVCLPCTLTTQDVLKYIIPWSSHGWVAVTGCQTKGRGRRGAIWLSPIGSVAISIKLHVRTSKPETLTFLQYIAALAVVEATQNAWDVNLRIKWPNDIYKGNEKVAGVLCEGTLRGAIFFVVVGVGVNVMNRFPTTSVVGDKYSNGREIFVGHFLSEFEKLYNQYQQQGFHGSLKDKYLETWMHNGQIVKIGSKNGTRAIVHGLSRRGWVQVLREDWNAIQELEPESTSLDIVTGVVKDKLIGPRGQ